MYKISEYEGEYEAGVNDFILIQSDDTIHIAKEIGHLHPAHPGGTTIIVHVYSARLTITTHPYHDCVLQPGLDIAQERATTYFNFGAGNRNRYLAFFFIFVLLF